MSVCVLQHASNCCKCTTGEERFRIVRTGQLETMKPSVKDISVVELAKKFSRSNVQFLECVQSVDVEVC
jgi:phosphate-selective porin